MFDVYALRAQFPALNQEVNGSVPVFLDGPGGTQVPRRVLEAMTSYLGYKNSNLLDSPFFAVRETEVVVRTAREGAAAFLNCDPREVVFGANMSSLTSHISRSIAREWAAGDEIIVTALDHCANVSFWEQAAADKGVTCHMVRIHPEDCTLDYEHLESLLSTKTKLVAFTLASNVCGSKTDALRIISLAKNVGALTYVDSVHCAPHVLPDVKALDCDFLACSAYKFFGPHLGILFGKAEHFERLIPYKVKPASNAIPECWETGTKSFEALAGFNSTMEYISNNSILRDNIKLFYEDIRAHENLWGQAFLKRTKDIRGLLVHGIDDPARMDERTATFAISLEGYTPQELSDHLANRNIANGASHFYGTGVTDALGLTEKGGVVRVGAVHYNTMEELDIVFNALEDLD